MYITCANCSTNFFVSPDKISPAGRKLRCSRCGYIWFHKPAIGQNSAAGPSYNQQYTNPQSQQNYGQPGPQPGPTQEPLVTPKEMPAQSARLPVLIPVAAAQTGAHTITMLLVSCFFLMVILFYESLGFKFLSASAHLRLKDIKVEKSYESDTLIVSYALENSSNEGVNIPLVRIRLFDENQKLIESYIDSRVKPTIGPKECILMTTEIASVPGFTDEVDVTLGNRLDFILH